MLTIRREQMRAFEAALSQPFRDRLLADLSNDFAARNLTPEPKFLAQQIEAGITRTREFGIVSECDVARYIRLMCRHTGAVLPEPFDKPILNVLYAYRASAEDKLNRLEEWLLESR